MIGRIWLAAALLSVLVLLGCWLAGRQGDAQPAAIGLSDAAASRDAAPVVASLTSGPGHGLVDLPLRLDATDGALPAAGETPGGVDEGEEVGSGADSEQGAMGAEAPASRATSYAAPIGRGGSLFQSLMAAGMSAQDAQPFLDALGEVVALKRLRPTDVVMVEAAPGGSVHRVEIERGPTERYEALAGADGVVAARVDIAIEKHVRRLCGTVKTSLYEAVVEAGGHPELVVRMADLLAWDVDFYTDPRPGDHFDVLVEEHWLDGAYINDGPVLMVSYEGERASQSACRFVLASGEVGYFDRHGKSLRKALLKSPLNYRRISSTFSHRRRHPITGRYRPHLGVDFAAPRGTPVVAVGSGTVQHAQRKGANGNMVILDHPNGYQTYYLHLSGFGRGIRRGARVQQGQVIGYVGSTGRSTGPHLDFRVKRHQRFINPLKLTLPPGPPVPEAEIEQFEDVWARMALVRDCIPGSQAFAGDPLRLGGHLRQLAGASAPRSVFSAFSALD
ncbi:MAG: peptidoglycan DD-metalloendopeptidase family protein [Candidatus Eiseniibacteriota bacterium]|jgi:hypothetical protein